MTKSDLQHKETLLLEVLLSGLDAHEAARGANAPMLRYLCDLVVRRARLELGDVRDALETQTEGGAAA